MQHPSCPDEQPFYNCFNEHRFILGKSGANPKENIELGYYLSNKVWAGFHFEKNEYSAYTFEGNYSPTPSCSQSASNPKWNDWYQCREGDKYRALDGDPENKGRMITVKRTLPDGTTENQEEKYGRWEYIWQSGNKYVGEYKDGKKNGQGTFTWAAGDKYVGEFKDNSWHGQGTYTFASGSKYVGEYKDGKKNGQAFVFITEGQTSFCKLKNGKTLNCIGTNANDVAVNLKNNFSALPASQRQNIQANLKRRNLYTSSIDGKWGRGTLIALIEFSSKNLGTVDLQSSSASRKLLDAVLR